MQSQRDAKVDEIALVKIEHGKIKGLTDKRLIETSRKYIIDREMAKLVGEKGEVEANIARAKARMSEIRIQIIAIDETARTEAQRELSSIEPKLSELQGAPRGDRRPSVARPISARRFPAPLTSSRSTRSAASLRRPKSW